MRASSPRDANGIVMLLRLHAHVAYGVMLNCQSAGIVENITKAMCLESCFLSMQHHAARNVSLCFLSMPATCTSQQAQAM